MTQRTATLSESLEIGEQLCAVHGQLGAKQTSGETFKQFAIRIQNAARHTDISQLDLVRIAINGARSGLVKSHLLMAAPYTMNALVKLPVVSNDDLYSNASLDQFSLLTAAVGKLTSQVAELSKSSTSASRNHVTPREQRNRHSAKPSDGRRQRMTPYRPQQLCKWCSLKFCQGCRLCVAYTQNCRNCGKMGHFEKCCYQPTNYFNAKHWRWLPTHKMGRPQLTKLLFSETSSNGVNQSKRKSDSNHSKKQPTQTKQKQKNKSPKVKSEPVIIQYQTDVHDLTNSSEYNLKFWIMRHLHLITQNLHIITCCMPNLVLYKHKLFVILVQQSVVSVRHSLTKFQGNLSKDCQIAILSSMELVIFKSESQNKSSYHSL